MLFRSMGSAPIRVDYDHTAQIVPTVVDKVYIVDRDLVAAVAEHRVLAKAIDRAPVEHKHPVGAVGRTHVVCKLPTGVAGTDLEEFFGVEH